MCANHWAIEPHHHWPSVSQNTNQSCLATTHRHVNSDNQTANCCPSQQTTQCSRAMLSAQPLLASGTVYQSPFDLHRLPTPFDDTWRLICSPTTPPSTNCFHPRLRFQLVLTHCALEMLTTYMYLFRPTSKAKFKLSCFDLHSTLYNKLYNDKSTTS